MQLRTEPFRRAWEIGLLQCTAVGLAAALLAGCSLNADNSEEPKPEGSAEQQPTEVVIATHDSWAVPEELLSRFEQESGYKLTIVPSGDAGTMTNKLVLTKGNPIADGVYGVDNTFGSRAVEEGVLADFRSEIADTAEFDLPGGEGQLTPIDWGDVCVNIDKTWFGEHDIPEPTTLEDLTKPAYRKLFVTPGAASSSPGFAFLLATISAYGDDWTDYWERLMANGAKLTSGWTDAYEVDFTAGGGDRPIVLSYNSSPPFTLGEDADEPTTRALLDTCFRQVEYAGVLAGAKNAEGAEAFIDFMSGVEFQESLADNMYVFPVNPAATLPPLWAKWAPAASDPLKVDPAEISANRKEWLTTWADITS